MQIREQRSSRKKMHSARNDIERLPFTTMQFLLEYHGNSTTTVQIINHLRGHVKQSEATAVNTVVKTANIFTVKLVKELEIDTSDNNFTQFRNFVEEKCWFALDSIYGDFASFTGPTLLQATLHAISDEFKTTLPKYYHSISALLNRTRYFNVKQFKHLQGQWDHEILYQFLTIC